jgi:hypothetical protein
LGGATYDYRASRIADLKMPGHLVYIFQVQEALLNLQTLVVFGGLTVTRVFFIGRSKANQLSFERPVIWFDEAAPLAASHKAVCGLGTTHCKNFIEQTAILGFEFATIIHPTARVSRTSSLGKGSILSAGV